jgi:hypothetical protein
MVLLVNAACYQGIEDHYHGQRYNERYEGIKSVIDARPGFPVKIQATLPQVFIGFF